MNLLQAFPSNMSINLNSRNIGMTQHGLDGPKVSPIIEKMGREGMPKGVRHKCFL